jgi:hypothetical protein
MNEYMQPQSIARGVFFFEKKFKKKPRAKRFE